VSSLNAPQGGASGEHSTQGNVLAKMPTRKQQSWGAVISIVIIILMIVIGAFYAWGERVSKEQPLPVPVQQ
jgi:hypothetical protein